jgi:diaminohydroxyphosphoribosylaminopyrimidine deaminase/5-amino-6-(5-phosphoribosylamino)uracil reductase
MRIALQLAEKGCGWVNPNPLVGAVIVKDGEIIGRRFHEKYGKAHAERNAIASCIKSPKGATLYATLEPCCHHGTNPPCTDAIIESGIKRVVIGSSDPNPLVRGKGVAIMRRHGIEVVEGVLKEECDKLNQVFFHYIQRKKPYVIMKYAMTMDGKIATYTGESKWITGEAARQRVHEDRHRYSGIMVGVGTVLADNPLLTCRMEGGKNPLRIICDTRLRTPINAH